MSELKDLLQPVGDSSSFIYSKHVFNNKYLDKEYIQLLYGNQSSSGNTSSTSYFDNKFFAPYTFSYSGLYQTISFYMRHVLENEYDKIAIQKYPGIWKPLSSTSTDLQITTAFQGIGISNYYYGDEIANSTFKLYYLPIVATGSTSSLSALQNQNVLKFFDINKNYDGPTFAIPGNDLLKNNLSGTTTGFSIELYSRFVPQDKEGYLFHRWTTNSNSAIIDSYNVSTTGAIDFPFYSAYPYYGVGCYYNFLTPIHNSDKENPYFDFYVFGELSSSTAHYINLTSNTINQQTFTRFYLHQDILNILFDGSFHALRFVWDKTETYKNGKLYLDNIELTPDVINGDGRNYDLSYSTTTSSTCSPFYFLSKNDNVNDIVNQSSSRFSTYNETKHILIFDKAITGTITNASYTSNQNIYSALGSSTSNLSCWFSFNSANANSYSAVDVTQTFGIKSSALTGNIVNDAASQIYPEGKIDRVYSLFHDKYNSFADSTFDQIQLTGSSSAIVQQKTVGKIYNNEYGTLSSMHIGYMFYDKAIMLILNDNYNSSFNSSTQLFISSTSSKFSVSSSTGNWKVEYLSFAGTKYISRKLLSMTADSNYFCKSRNESALFKGTDDKIYSKSNMKVISGIVWYDKNGIAIATTKFSQPIIKNENNSIAININIDL
jgi:hypothetical protein